MFSMNSPTDLATNEVTNLATARNDATAETERRFRRGHDHEIGTGACTLTDENSKNFQFQTLHGVTLLKN